MAIASYGNYENKTIASSIINNCVYLNETQYELSDKFRNENDFSSNERVYIKLNERNNINLILQFVICDLKHSIDDYLHIHTHNVVKIVM